MKQENRVETGRRGLCFWD